MALRTPLQWGLCTRIEAGQPIRKSPQIPIGNYRQPWESARPRMPMVEAAMGANDMTVVRLATSWFEGTAC